MYYELIGVIVVLIIISICFIGLLEFLRQLLTALARHLIYTGYLFYMYFINTLYYKKQVEDVNILRYRLKMFFKLLLYLINPKNVLRFDNIHGVSVQTQLYYIDFKGRGLEHKFYIYPQEK